jgi:hypothetical protein
VDECEEYLLQKINSKERFGYYPRQNATHVSFDPIPINNVNTLQHKKEILKKLDQLQALKQQIPARPKSRYYRDMNLFNIKKAAEKLF